MNCKCGNRLGWEDGAFCKACMTAGAELARLREIAEHGSDPHDRLAAQQLIQRYEDGAVLAGKGKN